MALRIQTLVVLVLLATSGSPLTHAGAAKQAPVPSAQPELASLQAPDVAPATHWTQTLGAALHEPAYTVSTAWLTGSFVGLALILILVRWMAANRRDNRVSIRREQNVLWNPRRK